MLPTHEDNTMTPPLRTLHDLYNISSLTPFNPVVFGLGSYIRKPEVLAYIISTECPTSISFELLYSTPVLNVQRT